MQDIFTVEEAAKILRCNQQAIRNAIKRGDLKAAKVGKGYRITEAALEDWFKALGGDQLFREGREKA